MCRWFVLTTFECYSIHLIIGKQFFYTIQKACGNLFTLYSRWAWYCSNAVKIHAVKLLLHFLYTIIGNLIPLSKMIQSKFLMKGFQGAFDIPHLELHLEVGLIKLKLEPGWDIFLMIKQTSHHKDRGRSLSCFLEAQGRRNNVSGVNTNYH